MSLRARIASVIVLIAAAWWLSGNQTPAPPTPTPTPAVGLDLHGLFVGPDAAADATTLAALADEIAAEIEWDGQQSEPWLTTGVAFDELRTRARAARMRGTSIGERQPRVRDAIAAYLDEQVGNAGGPVDASDRAAWVAAYRNIAGACRHAIR
jgi:hypothetical protein